MLPTLLFDTVGFILNLIIVLFLIYYVVRLRHKEQALEKKEKQTDASYHQIVDNALTKERKILEDATSEAGHILKDASYVNQNVHHTIDDSLGKMLTDVKEETAQTAKTLHTRYMHSLEQVANTSLTDFQTISHQLQTDLTNQLKQFHASLLPNMEKELEEYKKQRLKETEQLISKIVQRASEDILNKSISFEDHQKLLIESLEEAKKEGIFD